MSLAILTAEGTRQEVKEEELSEEIKGRVSPDPDWGRVEGMGMGSREQDGG